MGLAEQIRRVLKDTKLSQQDIATAAQIHRVNLSQFKAGDREIIDVRQLERIAMALGYRVELRGGAKRK